MPGVGWDERARADLRAVVSYVAPRNIPRRRSP